MYLEGDFANSVPPEEPAVTAELSQKKLQFSSTLLPVRVGTAVRFPNFDDEYHNVVSYSKAKTFDLGRYLKTEPAPVRVFSEPGLVELNCEIHEHMRAYILVLDTPHFTTTDEKGRYKLDNLPAGNYTLKVWIDRRTVLEQLVSLTDGKTTTVDFSKDGSEANAPARTHEHSRPAGSVGIALASEGFSVFHETPHGDDGRGDRGDWSDPFSDPTSGASHL